MITVDNLVTGTDYVASPTGIRYAVVDITDDCNGVWIIRVDEHNHRASTRRRKLTQDTADKGWTVEPRAIPNATYRPSVPGAETWRDARPFTVNGQHVSAEVRDGMVTVFVGTRMITEQVMPSTLRDTSDLYAWIIATARGLTTWCDTDTAHAINDAYEAHAAEMAAQDADVAAGALMDATVERYGTANPVAIESGVTPCACCGTPTMADDLAVPAYCAECAGPDCVGSGAGVVFDTAWHCPSGACDGSGCVGSEHVTEDDGLDDPFTF